MPPARNRRWLARLVLGLSAICTAPTSAAPPAGVAVEHLSDRTVARVGTPRVIAFRLKSPASTDLELHYSINPEGACEVLRPPQVLAGRDLGFVRIRASRPGGFTLDVEGATLEIRAVEPDGRSPWDPAPRVVTPASGAAVWGTFAVGVDCFQDPLESPITISLRLPSGETLEPASFSGPGLGPLRHAVFELDADALVGASVLLTPVATSESGRIEGDPIEVRLARPSPDQITAGEAEALFDGPRPQRFAEDGPNIGRDRECSGGAYFNNAGSRPAVCFPVEVATPGLYQMMVVASGSHAGGALPNIGLIIDGGDTPATAGRLASERWHRIAVGVPVRLEPGTRILTPYFTNDFYVPRLADRNLALDRIEVARIDGPALTIPALGGGGRGAMNAGAMTSGAMNSAGMDAGAMGGSMMAGPGRGTGDPLDQGGSPLRIAFERPLDGLLLPGETEITGMVFCDGAARSKDPAIIPVITLLLNGAPLASQRSLSPRFWVDPAALVAGENTIQLTAHTDTGLFAQTPVQHVRRIVEATDAPRRALRFSSRDAAWDEGAVDRLGAARNPPEQLAISFHTNAGARLTLPEELSGRFDVHLTALGEHFEGPPILRTTLEAGGEQTTLGDSEIATWWQTIRVGTIDLSKGPKELTVSFTNDRWIPNQGDRNVHLLDVELREVAATADTSAPVVELVWPAPDTVVCGADLAIFQVADDRGIAYCELLIDGAATGLGRPPGNRPRLQSLPILGRRIAPGEHSISIRARDHAGNVGLSEPRMIRVVSEEPAGGTALARAVHLLDRFAFGPDLSELAEVLTVGESSWLRSSLGAGIDASSDLTALTPGVVRFGNRASEYDVPRRALDYAIRTPNPARARFVLFAENHFSTWIRKTQGDRKWDEHAEFLRLGPTWFDRLLMASATSPAMLRYLDQDASYAGRINENYAREIMELHTLGVDNGYTQADVTSLAHLLTGWMSCEQMPPGAGGYSREFGFRFDPTLSDGRAHEVIGMRFEAAEREARFERVRTAIEALAAHPGTADHISRLIAGHYVGLPAPEGLVRDLAAVFVETGGDLREVLIAMASHPEFWARRDARRLAHPSDFAIRLSRVSGFENSWYLGDFLQRSGAGMFDRATPDGFPEEDGAYTDSNAMVQRWALADQAVWNLATLVPDSLRWDNAPKSETWAQDVIDSLALGLTGRVLGEASNRIALEFFESQSSSPGERVLAAATLVAQLPEANLR